MSLVHTTVICCVIIVNLSDCFLDLPHLVTYSLVDDHDCSLLVNFVCCCFYSAISYFYYCFVGFWYSIVVAEYMFGQRDLRLSLWRNIRSLDTLQSYLFDLDEVLCLSWCRFLSWDLIGVRMEAGSDCLECNTSLLWNHVDVSVRSATEEWTRATHWCTIQCDCVAWLLWHTRDFGLLTMFTIETRKVTTRGMIGDLLWPATQSHKFDMRWETKETKSCSVTWRPLMNDFKTLDNACRVS